MSLLPLLIHCFVSSEEREELNCISNRKAVARNTCHAQSQNHLTWLSWAKEHSTEGADAYKARKPGSVPDMLNLHTTIFLEYTEKMLVQKRISTPCHTFQRVKSSICSQATARVHIKQVLNSDSRHISCECSKNYQVSLN